MKKKYILLFSLFFFVQTFSQNKEIELDSISKLKSLGKVWGFLKYYHPKVSKGKFDWDKELISIIPEVLNSKSKKDLNNTYQKWINSLGKIKHRSVKKSNVSHFEKNFNLSWIDNSPFFSKETSLKLREIERYRNTGSKYYVSQNLNIGNIHIENEKKYPNIGFPNIEHRILNLFRYWNIIEYFSPNKYLTSKDWDETLQEMIPRFIKATNPSDYHLLILELVASTNDGHAAYFTKETNTFFGFYWAPFKYKVIDNKVVLTSYYNEKLTRSSGLEIGDIITQIDGEDAFKKLDNRLKYTPGSNKNYKQNSIYTGLFNGSKKEVSIKFLRNGKLHSTVLKRYKFNELKYTPNIETKKWKITKNNIGYVDLSTIKATDIESLMSDLSNCNGIIFDLRKGAKNLWGGLGKYIKKKRSPFVKLLRPDLSYPGKFYFKEAKNCCYELPEKKLYKGKVVLLVNENTYSHGEFTTMALQSGDKVTTIGNQTAGADGDVSYIPLLNNKTTSMTGIGVYYPNGLETQKKGVKIDIEVKPTIEGVIKQKDEILTKAISFLEKNYIFGNTN